MKTVKFGSMQNLTYFRGKDDELAKLSLMEEELQALREIAEKKKKEKLEESIEKEEEDENSVVEENKEPSEEESEELLPQRDSFCLDYIPGFNPEHPNNSDQEMEGLNKDALKRLDGSGTN